MRVTEQLRIKLLSFLGFLVYRALLLTLRWTDVGMEGERKHWSNGEARVLAFWHNQQIMMPYIWLSHKENGKAKPIHVLISQHGDGRIIAGTIELLGLSSVAGSSSKGGSEALRKLVEITKKGCHVVFTPDGPKGPIYKSKPGVVRLAQLTGVPITPMALYADRKWIFKSWDRMFLPKPFSKVAIGLGEEIPVPRELSEEDFTNIQNRLDIALNELTERCQKAVESQ